MRILNDIYASLQNLYTDSSHWVEEAIFFLILENFADFFMANLKKKTKKMLLAKLKDIVQLIDLKLGDLLDLCAREHFLQKI